jgi:regulator of replication initiation timing
MSELSLEKRKYKALEESLEHEAIENKKLLDNVRKLNTQLNSIKDKAKLMEIVDENNALKRRLDVLQDDHKEQLTALRRNMEHMFQENQTLKDENLNLKANLPSGSSQPTSPVSDENKPHTSEFSSAGEENAPSVSPQRPAIDRRFTSQERDELQTKLLLLKSEAEELRYANEELEAKLAKSSEQKSQFDADSQRLLSKLSQLQLDQTNVGIDC